MFCGPTFLPASTALPDKVRLGPSILLLIVRLAAAMAVLPLYVRLPPNATTRGAMLALEFACWVTL